jgi:ferredoxin
MNLTIDFDRRVLAATEPFATMPDYTNRHSRNAAGPYYVDDTCTDCDLCRTVAPAVFARCDDSGTSFVHSQPRTPEELALAEEARAACPTESIGSDGPPEEI